MPSRFRAISLFFGFSALCFAQSNADLGLLLRFDSKPSPLFVSTMERELSSILSPAALKIHWAIGADSNTYPHALVITFHGTCRTRLEIPYAESDDKLLLGETRLSQGVILPYSEIDCDSVRAFLGATGEANFGRATGRVLAHEIYHVLLQTRAHSKKGIAKAVHTPAALLSQSLRFEDGELERIRSLYR